VRWGEIVLLPGRSRWVCVDWKQRCAQ